MELMYFQLIFQEFGGKFIDFHKVWKGILIDFLQVWSGFESISEAFGKKFNLSPKSFQRIW